MMAVLLATAPQTVRAQPATVRAVATPLATRAAIDVATHARVHAQVRIAQRAVETGREQQWRVQWDSARIAAADRSLALLLRATMERVAYRGPAAESLYRALEADSVREPVVAAHAALGRALLAVQTVRLDQADQHYRRARDRFARLGDSVGQAESLDGLAFVSLRTDGIAAATGHVAAARLVLPRTDAWLAARLSCTQALIRVRARIPIPDAEWRQLLARAVEGGPRTVAQCLLARAQAIEVRGQPESALVVLDSLLIVQRSARVWSGLAATRQWQGWLNITLGQFSEARAALNESISLGDASGSIGAAGWANLNLASLSQNIGAWADAERYADRAMIALRESRDEIGVLFARRSAAEGALLRGDLARAEQEFDALAEVAERLSPQLLVEDLIARAEIARRQGRPADAVQLLDSAQRTAARRELPGWRGAVDYQRALLDIAATRYGAASSRLRALLVRESTLSTPAQFEVLSRVAQAEAGAGRLDEAERQMRLAMERSDQWRRGLTHRDLVLTALQSRHIDWSPDQGMAVVIGALSGAGQHTAAAELAEWRRARLLQRTALQRAAFTDAPEFAPIGVSPATIGQTSAQRPTLTPAPFSVPRPAPGVAVIAYVVGNAGEPMTAFVSTAESVQSVRLAQMDDLPGVVGRFVALLEAGRHPRPAARRLAATFIDPLLPLLPASVRRIVVVPDGTLHRLPFAALVLRDNTLLAQRFDVATAPSIAIAARGLTRARSTGGSERSGVLAIGAPNRLPDAEDGSVRWRPLPGARAELRAVLRQIDGSEMLSGSQATVQGFREAVRRGGPVLHLATHADAYDASLTESGLALEPTAAEDGVLRAPALAIMSLPFDLVVLSACESAEGMLVTGEGLQGLTSAVLEAGSRSVIATRWRLEDATAGTLISEIYEQVSRGSDAVSALASVRRASIARGDSPSVWANLEYVGDPTVVVRLTARRRPWWALLGGAVVPLAVVAYLVAGSRKRRRALRD